MMNILRSRQQVPRVQTNGGNQQERLIILPGEDEQDSTEQGRPIGDEYWNIDRKLEFMKVHGITHSIVSSANPWLDFITTPKEQVAAAIQLNTELSEMHTTSITRQTGIIYGFGVLPMLDIQACIQEVHRLASLPGIKGIIMGTHGAGKGMDDPTLLPLYEAIAQHSMMIFVHPHYGIDTSHFGEIGQAMGHTLPLALGFPFETTIAISRLILAGVLDKVPDLKLLLAHSGGTLPFLAGRLDSCVEHDPVAAQALQHPPSFYLKKLYYDNVCYHASSLKCLLSFIDPDRVLFGTDNPFFPPLNTIHLHQQPWESVVSNIKAMEYLDQETRDKISWKNANRLFQLGINE